MKHPADVPGGRNAKNSVNNNNSNNQISKRSNIMNSTKMFRTVLVALVSIFILSNIIFAGDFKNGGTVNNGASTTFLVKTGSFINCDATNSRPGTVNNSGTIWIPTLTKNFENGDASFAGTVTNSSGGYIYVRQDFNNNVKGTVNNSSGAVIRVYRNFVHTTGTGSVTNDGTIQVKNTLTAPTGFTTSSGAVELDSTGDQTIPALTYATLRALSGGTKTLAGQTTVNTLFEDASSVTVAVGTNKLTLAGTVTTGGTLTSGASGTVEYTGAIQNVIPASYGNLTLGGSGTKTSTGTVSIAGSYSNDATNNVTLVTVGFTTVSGATFASNTGLTQASGVVTIADVAVNIGGTFEYTTNGQNVAAGQYTTLKISNGLGGTVTLPTAVSITGNYQPTGAGSRDYSTHTATLTFNGTSNQSIAADASGSYYALSFSGNSEKDVTGSVTTTSDFTIASSVSGAVGVKIVNDLTVGGNLLNDGTLTNGGSITVN